MTVVDVNTGKFVGSGGNLEETVTKNNLEAAEEIVRQLRLRDIGGIIVVDFIDMVLESNRDLVLRRLVECLCRDRTKHQVAEVTSLGLVQMTRKKLGLGLLESFSEPCEVCAGRGIIVHHDPVVKHRAAPAGRTRPQPRARRRRRWRQPAARTGGGVEGPAPAPTRSPRTCKHALAQIAAAPSRTPSTSRPRRMSPRRPPRPSPPMPAQPRVRGAASAPTQDAGAASAGAQRRPPPRSSPSRDPASRDRPRRPRPQPAPAERPEREAGSAEPVAAASEAPARVPLLDIPRSHPSSASARCAR